MTENKESKITKDYKITNIRIEEGCVVGDIEGDYYKATEYLKEYAKSIQRTLTKSCEFCINLISDVGMICPECGNTIPKFRKRFGHMGTIYTDDM